MEHKLTSNQETACYIDIMKRILAIRDENISGEDIFFLINGYRIVYNNWLGYDYEKELANLSFVKKVDKNHDSVKKFICQEDMYGIIAFINSSALTYNEIYKKNNGKIHCIRIINSSKENLTIEDTHIRVNDKIIRSQVAELPWKQLEDVEAVIYVINIQRMHEEYMTYQIAQNVDKLDEFLNSEGCGINAIENYLKEKYVFIDYISPKDMIDEIQNIYYNLKINSYIYICK